PLKTDPGCGNSPGTFGMFDVDNNYKIVQRLAQFNASELINTEWIEPGKQINTIFPATSVIPDGVGNKMVTAYAVLRPDKQWAIMLVNRDQEVGHSVQIAFMKGADGKPLSFQGR
ncbi:MAG: glycosyl hydrolase family 5, partial [Acidobacteriaceae bacterium]